ncbi:MAG: peptidoglycan-associated lipoprotein Pal [Acidobacteria bacterium]|nr:peptidoglycan-associated lipoprotein Pal [Acidobacteriota bacterium]
MSRIWMALGIVAIALGLLTTACGPKPSPTTPADLEVEETPPPAEPVTPPPAPPMEDDMTETPWWQDKSLVELNDEAERLGFHRQVYFALDESSLGDEARQQLTDNARFLKEHPELKVTIEGHCDERGTNEYNLALGDRRAHSAGDYMSSLGVSPSREKTISYGEERPVCTESTESCWARNRRAYFILSAS